MGRKDFVEKALRDTLQARLEILEHWRGVHLSKANRIKNFENWLQVELVHAFLEQGVSDVRTNGCFHGDIHAHRLDELRNALPTKAHLLGDKNTSQSVSPDISMKKEGWPGAVEIEMKTQGNLKVIAADLAVVETVNAAVGKDGTLSCFLWVVAIPRDKELADAATRSFRAIEDALQLEMKPMPGDWLWYTVEARGAQTG